MKDLPSIPAPPQIFAGENVELGPSPAVDGYLSR